jgi:hypothetical protein
VGQVVRDEQVTLGYLLSRPSTSGGHCEVGGSSGELACGGVEGLAVGVAGKGWGGGETEKNKQWLGRGEQNTRCITINGNIMLRKKIQAKNWL